MNSKRWILTALYAFKTSPSSLTKKSVSTSTLPFDRIYSLTTLVKSKHRLAEEFRCLMFHSLNIKFPSHLFLGQILCMLHCPLNRKYMRPSLYSGEVLLPTTLSSRLHSLFTTSKWFRDLSSLTFSRKCMNTEENQPALKLKSLIRTSKRVRSKEALFSSPSRIRARLSRSSWLLLGSKVTAISTPLISRLMFEGLLGRQEGQALLIRKTRREETQTRQEFKFRKTMRVCLTTRERYQI